MTSQFSIVYGEFKIKAKKMFQLAVMTLTDCLRLTSPFESHSIIMENLDRLATSLDPLRANIYKR